MQNKRVREASLHLSAYFWKGYTLWVGRHPHRPSLWCRWWWAAGQGWGQGLRCQVDDFPGASMPQIPRQWRRSSGAPAGRGAGGNSGPASERSCDVSLQWSQLQTEESVWICQFWKIQVFGRFENYSLTATSLLTSAMWLSIKNMRKRLDISKELQAVWICWKKKLKLKTTLYPQNISLFTATSENVDGCYQKPC